MTERVCDTLLDRTEQSLVQVRNTSAGKTARFITDLHTGNAGKLLSQLVYPRVKPRHGDPHITQRSQSRSYMLVAFRKRFLGVENKLLQPLVVPFKQYSRRLQHHPLVGKGVPHRIVNFTTDPLPFRLESRLFHLQGKTLVLHIGVNQTSYYRVLFATDRTDRPQPFKQDVNRNRHSQRRKIDQHIPDNITRRYRQQRNRPRTRRTLLYRHKNNSPNRHNRGGIGIDSYSKLDNQRYRQNQFQSNPVTQRQPHHVQKQPLNQKRNNVKRLRKRKKKDR